MAKQLKNRVMLLLQEKERKENRRISSSEVARAINVAPNTVGSWIRNEVTKIEAHVLIGLCDYFECKIDELIYIEVVEDETSA